MSKRCPMWPPRASQAADWPRLAEAPGSPRHDLALRGASGEPAGRSLSSLVLDTGRQWWALRSGDVARRTAPAGRVLRLQLRPVRPPARGRATALAGLRPPPPAGRPPPSHTVTASITKVTASDTCSASRTPIGLYHQTTDYSLATSNAQDASLGSNEADFPLPEGLDMSALQSMIDSGMATVRCHVGSGACLLPRLSAPAFCGWLSRLPDALRTQDELPNRSGPGGRLRSGPAKHAGCSSTWPYCLLLTTRRCSTTWPFPRRGWG